MNGTYCDLRIRTESRAVDRLVVALRQVQDTKGVNDGRLSHNMGGKRLDKRPDVVSGCVLGVVRANK
jgi:hypothetical protein